MPRLEREKNVIARIMRVEVDDIKTQFYYPIDFKHKYSIRVGFPRDSGVQTMCLPV